MQIGPGSSVAGERIHFGGAVLHRPLQLLVSPGEKDLQPHIFWYARELGPSRYANLGRAIALSAPPSERSSQYGLYVAHLRRTTEVAFDQRFDHDP